MIKDKDLGFNEIKKQIAIYSQNYIKVGIQTNAGLGKDSQSVAEYATQNEFGTEIIPERSFIRSTADQKKADWDSLILDGYSKVLDQKATALVELAKIGIKARDDIKAKINSNIAPENAPSTKLQKAGSKLAETHTLIDTGRMLNSIQYAFVRPSDV